MTVLNDKEAVPSVADFYDGQELLVTGSTGFLGKSLLEKLLYACPKIKTIYLLLRPKRGCAVEKRLEDLKKDMAFDRCKAHNPAVMDKLVAIAGDVRELGLQISEESLERIKNVTILIHGAATVRFDEPLQESIIMNTRGTREVLELAKGLKKLRLFAHMSTAYTNPHLDLTDEKLYHIDHDWRDVIKMAETLSLDELEAVSKKFIDYHPNSYTFSKQVSEHMVNDYRKDLPIIIHRPSIVSPSVTEPTAGWVDNFNGPVGLMIPIGLGFSRILLGKNTTRLNFVPVDYISNSFIAIMAQSTEELERNSKEGLQLDEVMIFNYGVDKTKGVKIEDLMSYGENMCAKYPFESMIWYPGASITNSIFLYKCFFYVLQLFPGLIAELLLRTLGYKFSVLRMLRKIFYVQVSLLYFMSKEFDFKNKNTWKSYKALSNHDQKMFPCAADLEFQKYFTACTLGARNNLMHEDPKSIPRTRIKYRIFQVLHYSLIAVFWFYVVKRLFAIGTSVN